MVVVLLPDDNLMSSPCLVMSVPENLTTRLLGCGTLQVETGLDLGPREEFGRRASSRH